jgi:hypothetical protein
MLHHVGQFDFGEAFGAFGSAGYSFKGHDGVSPLLDDDR